MKRSTVTTASVFFPYGWARFMSTGFFAMGEKDER